MENGCPFRDLVQRTEKMNDICALPRFMQNRNLKDTCSRVGKITDCATQVYTYRSGHISQLGLLRKVSHQPAKRKRRSRLTILHNEPVKD